MSEDAAADPPTTLGGYTLLEVLGRGGMGEVWRAERVGPAGVRRRAAVKCILEGHRGDPVLRERFLAEARISAKLEHPNVVQVLDFGDAPYLYLVLEYVEGLSFADLMRKAAAGGAELPLEAVLFVVAEAAAGLDYAHRKRDANGQALEIVHRDVSPPNILLSLDGAVKVSDFGVARARDNTLRTLAGAPPGKLAYMAPEQAKGDRVDARADVFALGVVLWEAIALRPMLPRESPGATLEALTRGEYGAPSRHAKSKVPPEIDRLVLDALRVDPNLRTPSAARLSELVRAELRARAPHFDAPELTRIVRKAMGLNPPSVAPPSPSPSTPRVERTGVALAAERPLAPTPPAMPAVAPAPTPSPSSPRASAPSRPTLADAPRSKALASGEMQPATFGPAPATRAELVVPPSEGRPTRRESRRTTERLPPARARSKSRGGSLVLGVLLLLLVVGGGASLYALADTHGGFGDGRQISEVDQEWLRQVAARCASYGGFPSRSGTLVLTGPWIEFGSANALQVVAQPDTESTRWVRDCFVRSLAGARAPDEAPTLILRGTVVGF